jgi:hypothetical protein
MVLAVASDGSVLRGRAASITDGSSDQGRIVTEDLMPEP